MLEKIVLQNIDCIETTTQKAFIISILSEKKLRRCFLKILRRDGLISSIRWNFWLHFMRMNKSFSLCSNDIQKKFFLFQKIKQQEAPYEEFCISKDVTRTFCKSKHFQHKDDFGCSKLTEVLKGLSGYFPQIGYVQGMNFLAGFVLIQSGFEAFETWDFLTNFFNKRRNLYFGIYAKNFPVLNFISFSLKRILQLLNKRLAKHFEEVNFPFDIWVNKWFLCFFILILPHEYLLRTFDFLLFSDVFGMVIVALMILNQMEGVILGMSFEQLAFLFNDNDILKDHLNYKKFCASLKDFCLDSDIKIQILQEYK